MDIRIRADSVVIEGYVNSVERRSKPLKSRIGEFTERICKGAFKNAIARNDNIQLLENHNWDRVLGNTKEGTLTLVEDNIGLKATATIRDTTAVEKAKNGDYIGWSFGFKDIAVDTHDENGMPTRDVKELELYEVSILDRTRTPAYDGTLVSVRSDNDIQYHGESLYSESVIRDENSQRYKDCKKIDYSKFEKMISDMKKIRR